MLIKEIFNFQDGSIVFAGEISGESNFIRECVCDLFVDNQLVTKVLIEGEMITKGGKINLRSLSTKNKINIAIIPYHDKNVWLKYQT
ncbi:MAG: hypothetical protein P4M12_02540 [Gammaproteobacteria bacterium]|nr:hypothetical protein [Gammaproteobacteria bacterium]